MKKIIMGLLCLSMHGVQSQCIPALPTTVLNKDWKWWLLNPNDPNYAKTWSYQYQTNCKLVLCPWLESVSPKLVNIIATNDFLPANGWELLDKNLGASISVGKFPYFILYNRNSGILRVFAYNRTLDGKSAKSVGVSLSMVPKQSPLSKRETALISLYEPAANSPQYYQDNVVVKNTSATILSEVRSDEAWVVVDFNMGFEPNTNASIFNDNFITIDLVSIEEANISLQGSMVGTTTSYNDFKGSLALPGTLEDIYSDMDVAGLTTNTTVNNVTAKKIDLSSLQDNLSKYKDKLSNLEKAEDNVANISKKSGEIVDKYLRDGVGANKYVDGAIFSTAMKTYNLTKNGSSFKKIASTVSNIAKYGGPILEFAGTIVGFLASGDDEKPMQEPVANKQIFTPTISRSYLKLTGTITSTLAKQRISLIVPGSNVSTGSYNQSFVYLNSSLYNCPLGIYNINTPTATVQTFKSPLDRKRDDYAVVYRYPIYAYGNFWGYGVASDPHTAFGYNYYNMKRVTLNSSLSQYINSSSEMELVDVQVALSVNYKPIKKTGSNPENSSPFVFMKDYAINTVNTTTMADMSPSEFNIYETLTLVSPYSTLPDVPNTRDVTLSSTQTVASLTVSPFGSVILKPGTTIQQGKDFRAYITPKYILPANTTTVPAPVYTTSTLCQSSIKYNSSSYRMGDEEQSLTQQIENSQGIVHPNPITSGNLNFGRTVSNYTLMNSTGAVMQQGVNTDKLDVAGLSKGMYMLKLDDKIEKVIVE